MLHILYFCFNNYDILIGENSYFLKKNSKKITLIDDHSTNDELIKGENIAREFNLKILVNPFKGIQKGLEYFMQSCCLEADWILVLQQDVKFEDPNAIGRIEKKIVKINSAGYNIGAFGFPNYVSCAHYHRDHNGLSRINWRNTWLGVFNLTPASLYKRYTLVDRLYRLAAKLPYIDKIERRIWQKVIVNRNFAERTLPSFSQVVNEYEGFSAVDLPVWTAVVLSVKAWQDVVIADPKFVFHLWFPDVAMQLMNNDFYVCLDTSELILNNWVVKGNYGLLDSVNEGRKKDGRMERYGQHFRVWRDKWGIDYEDPFIKPSNMVTKNSILDLMLRKNSLSPVKKFML